MNPREARELRAFGRGDPVGWIKEVFGIHLLSHQERTVVSVHQNRRTATKAGHGVGKTTGAAAAFLSYLFAFEDAIGVSTATTRRQVVDLLWRDIRMLLSRAKKRGYDLGESLSPKAPRMDIDEKWFAFGFTADDAESSTGQHSEHLIAVIDEASGVPDHVWNGIEGMLTTKGARLLSISNPTRGSGRFFDEFRNPNTVCFTVSVLDALEEIEALPEPIPGLTNREWVEERRTMPGWGEGSTLWQVKVLGEFPDDDEELLIPMSWYEAAKERAYRDAESDDPGTLGLDVAGAGVNSSVLYSYRGNRLARRMAVSGLKPRVLTPEVLGIQKALSVGGGLPELRVDGDGIGSEVCDRIEEHEEAENAAQEARAHKDGVPIPPPYFVPHVRIRSGMPAKDSDLHANRRAEIGWEFRHAFDPDGPDPISVDPEDDELQGQTTAIKWGFDPKGRILLEAKRKMTKSPDHYDAAAYSVCKTRFRPRAVVLYGDQGDDDWTESD